MAYRGGEPFIITWTIRFNQATVLTHPGDSQQAAGHCPAAADSWQQALAILDDMEHPDAAGVRAKLASVGGGR